MSPSASDVVERFKALNLGGFISIGFAFRDRETFSIRLMEDVFADGGSDLPYSMDFVLTFNLVVGGSIEAAHPELGLIEQWSARKESDLLSEFEPARFAPGEDFAHFEIAGGWGRVHVVARDFSYAMVRKTRVDRGNGRRPSGDRG